MATQRTVLILAAALAAAPLGAGSASAAPAAPAAAIQVRWDWSMPTLMVDRLTFVPTEDRSDPDWAKGGSYVPGPDGIPDRPMRGLRRYRNAGSAVYGVFPRSRRFAVRLDASASTGSGSLHCRWAIADGGAPTRAAGPCRRTLTVRLPEGRHRVMLTVSDGTGASRTAASHITVKNVLMAILGDSYGSGEGFPPFTEPSAAGGRQIDWDYPSCNRSRWSGFVRAAQAVESADPRSNVTLVDVACAGGEVDKGYIRTITSTSPPTTAEIPTGGIRYPKRRLLVNGEQLPGYEQPQIDQVRAITRGAPVDSVLLSIGGNDAGLTDIGIACALEDLADPNCYNEVPFYWDTVPNARPLYEVVQDNLTAVAHRYRQMAPCFGSGAGTCRTTKVVGGEIATSYTPARPVNLRKPRGLIHAVYPDVTSGTDGSGAVVPCSNTPVPESPMNQIDNSWAYEGLYIGVKGQPYTLPSTYSPPLPAPDPATIDPDADGLATLITANAQRYGWTPQRQVFMRSRGHGLCAGDQAWEYGLAQAQVLQNPANPAGALHPNDLGQEAYAVALGGTAQQVTGVPVHRWPTSLINGRG